MMFCASTFSNKLGSKSPEAKAFCLNRYKFISVHGRKSNELDSTYNDSIVSLCAMVKLPLDAREHRNCTSNYYDQCSHTSNIIKT